MIGCEKATYDKVMEMISLSFSAPLTLRERRIVEIAARTAYKHALRKAIEQLADLHTSAG